MKISIRLLSALALLLILNACSGENRVDEVQIQNPAQTNQPTPAPTPTPTPTPVPAPTPEVTDDTVTMEDPVSEDTTKRFSVEEKKGVAIDNNTKYVWQNMQIGHGDQDGAVERCESLVFAGITEWRLPTSAESKIFHAHMNKQGDVPKQAFDRCTAEITSDGYVRTKKGAQKYGGNAGDSINFSAGANIRCVSTGTDMTPVTPKPETPETPIKVEENNTEVPVLDSAVKQLYLDVINEARSKSQDCGSHGVKPAVPALKWSNALYKSSYQHSNDLAQTNTFSHTGSGKVSDKAAQALHPGKGSDVGERIEHAGYKNWRAYGENIAAGTVMEEAQEAVDGWIKSPGHCVNLMSPNFAEVGMAHVLKSDSHYTHYWTQDFGKK